MFVCMFVCMCVLSPSHEARWEALGKTSAEAEMATVCRGTCHLDLSGDL